MRAAIIVVVFFAVTALVLTACSNDDTSGEPTPEGTSATETAAAPTSTDSAPAAAFGPAPSAPSGPNDAAAERFSALVTAIGADGLPDADLAAFVEAADARHAWLLSDLMRFIRPDSSGPLLEGFATLTGVDVSAEVEANRSPWNTVTNHLIAWDLPAPEEYRLLKRELFTLIEPGWAPFFDDADATIDWRWVSWGGVLIDDRPLGDSDPCPRGCIPSLDDPLLVPADEGDWYSDDAIVFGVTEGTEAVAFPKNMMQIHEMVNITIGGRRFGIPYCTLCGSAQAFVTDDVPDGVETPVLRTSGLLSRSNKVMYDLVTSSAFDTFTGEAVTGPLREAGVVLDQNSVTVSTWGDWKAAYPDTMIVAEDGGIGRTYDADPLRGRDDNGPIFPIGDVDPRLDVQAPVVGVALDDGGRIAFDRAAADAAFAEGTPVELDGVTLRADAGGYVAVLDGDEVATHEAFWFAWSQFHPDTRLWPNDS